MNTDTETEQLLSQGFVLLERNCFSCHSPEADPDKRVAPPMVAIKRHYIDENTSRADFTQALTAFVQQPTEENVRMPGALQRFGLMPKMDFEEAELRAIAYYIYETELEAPDWFEEHYQKEREKHRRAGSHAQSDLERGKSYAMQTKSVLGKNLLGAIKTKGTEGALAFCNTRAYPLTDSMAQVLDVHIKRVSDRPRNPQNQANETELAYIETTKSQLEAGEKPKPKLLDLKAKVVGYYPIITNKMCMQCHGKSGEEIKPGTLTRLAELYPDDQAQNYGINELRGIWVVKMPK